MRPDQRPMLPEGRSVAGPSARAATSSAQRLPARAPARPAPARPLPGLPMESSPYSELEAIKVIVQLFDGMDLRFTALKITKKYNITRTVIVNAIRKLESAGIIESRSLGTKGTYIKIKNQNIKNSLLAELKHS